MKSNRLLLYFILGYISLLLLQHAFLFLRINDYRTTSAREITVQVPGEVKFCYNHPPFIPYGCPSSILQEERLLCQINTTDEDSHLLSFDYYFLSGPSSFYISPSGYIDFRPNSTQVGNFTFRLSVWDNSGCNNNLYSDIFSLEVQNINDPPVLINPIPNQTWNQDTSLVAFDLDNYFWDPDGDPINYTWVLLDSINVQTDSDNYVTFTPIPSFTGTESILFFAWDPYYANSSSNNVTLTVVQTISKPDTPPPLTGSSGGGGGGGSPPSCLPRWYCRPWGVCEPDSLMRRDCYDLNNCSSTFGMPNITQECDFISTCYDGFMGPGEEGIDCGGPCPPCGSCYDNTCNNNEDCTRGLIKTPDCGGPCTPCQYKPEGTCYDLICNNNEDCTRGLTDIPDCGGPCGECPSYEKPEIIQAANFGLISLLLLSAILLGYLLKKGYGPFLVFAKKRKRKQYEERLLLEAKVSESIYESIVKIGGLLGKEDIDKIIVLFSSVVRNYFKNLLNMKYEFTYEELMEEIESRNISPTFKSVLRKFFERSTEIEFSGKSISVQEMAAMISEFKQILSFTTESQPIKDEKAEESPKQKTVSKLDMIYVKIAEAESLLRRGDINNAYFIYLRIVHEFKYLPEKDRGKLHGFVTRLYEEIRLTREKYSYSEEN